MIPLDEAALRRPEWVEGVAIRLADGAEWHFPKPLFELFPVVAENGSVELGGKPTFDAGYDDLLESYLASVDPLDRVKALFALAVDLLKRNYTLAPADYQRLLRFHGPNTTHQATWAQIASVATGSSPKPSPVGDAPTSAPTG